MNRPSLEAVKTARLLGDEIAAREAEIAVLRDIIESGLLGIDEETYEPLEAWWPALAAKRLRQLDMVVGR